MNVSSYAFTRYLFHCSIFSPGLGGRPTLLSVVELLCVWLHRPGIVMRALVIDDDEVYRLLVRTALEGRGWDVEEAWDGQAGWQLFQMAHYDLVVTDIIMPHQEGLETIRLIRGSRADVRIVAISGGGLHRGSYLRAARWFGADTTLAKPFSPVALLASVEGVMGAAMDSRHVLN